MVSNLGGNEIMHQLGGVHMRPTRLVSNTIQ